jgi:hypothetical protein
VHGASIGGGGDPGDPAAVAATAALAAATGAAAVQTEERIVVVGERDRRGLDRVNRYLRQGWKVKSSSAAQVRDSLGYRQPAIIHRTRLAEWLLGARTVLWPGRICSTGLAEKTRTHDGGGAGQLGWRLVGGSGARPRALAGVIRACTRSQGR